MKKIKNIVWLIVLGSFSNTTPAALLDFNDASNLGVTSGGSMTWDSRGGGHLFSDITLDNDYISFSTETYINSFEMNAMAWLDFNRGNIWSIDIAGLNSSGQTIWETTVDLAGYTDWSNWLTISVETAAITQLTFFATGNDGFWPSIDNMVINEVPVPAAIWLFVSGLAGIFGTGLSRRFPE